MDSQLHCCSDFSNKRCWEPCTREGWRNFAHAPPPFGVFLHIIRKLLSTLHINRTLGRCSISGLGFGFDACNRVRLQGALFSDVASSDQLRFCVT